MLHSVRVFNTDDKSLALIDRMIKDLEDGRFVRVLPVGDFLHLFIEVLEDGHGFKAH